MEARRVKGRSIGVVPTLFILNKDHWLVATHMGYDSSEHPAARLSKWIESLVATPTWIDVGARTYPTTSRSEVLRRRTPADAIVCHSAWR
jgi:hypothetical protein